MKRVEPGQVRDRRIGEGADGGDGHAGRERALAGLDLPPLGVAVPAHREDLVVKADVAGEVVAGDDLAHVVPDLLLAGERLAPARVLLGGPRVEDARDVAGAAGVGVVAPGAAEIVGALEDHEVVEAGPLQSHREAEA